MTKRSLLLQGKKRKHDLTGVPIHTSKGKLIGQVNADIFQKDIVTKWILDRPFPCIASDIYSLHEAERAGAEYVEFTNTDDGVIYRASISKFWTLGKYINFVGDQQALGLEHFEHRRDPSIETQSEAPEYSDADSTHAEAKPLLYESHATIGTKFEKGVKQLSLWGRK